MLKKFTVTTDIGEQEEVKWGQFWEKSLVSKEEVFGWIGCGQQPGKFTCKKNTVVSGFQLFSLDNN